MKYNKILTVKQTTFTGEVWKMEIDKFVHLNKLFILYRNLLTEKQSIILDYYFGEDLSLGEISEEMNVSRQAIHDTVKRCESILIDYEEKLGLYKQEIEENEKLEKMISILESLKSEYSLNDNRIDKIIDICKELSE